MAVLLVAALAARASHGAELHSSLDTSARWNSNARGAGDESGESAQSDVLLDARARFDVISDPGGRFSWRLGYSPAYERFLDIQELDNWRHRGFASVQYALTSSTQVGASGEFSRSTRTNLDPVFDDVDPVPEPTLDETDETIERGTVSVNLGHSFGRRWTGNTSASYSFTDYAREDRSDFEGANAAAGVNYAMSARQSLGGGVQFSRQVIDQADFRTGADDFGDTDAEQETRFASLFGSWTYQLSPLWRLDTRAGPTFIDSDLQETATIPLARVPTLGISLGGDPPTVLRFPYDASQCSVAPCEDAQILQFVLPADFQSPEVEVDPNQLLDQDTSTTVFANVAIVRSGERSRFALTYSRSAGENYGGRTSTVSDVLSSRFTWLPDADWRFDFRASYLKQVQATSVDVIEGFPLVPNDGTVAGLPPNAAILDLQPDGSVRVRTGTVDDAVDIDSWAVQLRAARRITRRLSGFLVLRYMDQRNNGLERGVADDLDQFEVGLGLSYAFDPLRL